MADVAEEQYIPVPFLHPHFFFKETGFGDFEGKGLVIVGLPGAFTPTCSQSQVPDYARAYYGLYDFGYEVIVVSVNDQFVMDHWHKHMCDYEENAHELNFFGDWNGAFTKAMGMMVNKNNKQLGDRSWRYAAVFDEDGHLEKVFQEEGKADNVEGDPYEVSKAKRVLEYLRKKA